MLRIELAVAGHLALKPFLLPKFSIPQVNRIGDSDVSSRNVRKCVFGRVYCLLRCTMMERVPLEIEAVRTRSGVLELQGEEDALHPTSCSSSTPRQSLHITTQFLFSFYHLPIHCSLFCVYLSHFKTKTWSPFSPLNSEGHSFHTVKSALGRKSCSFAQLSCTRLVWHRENSTAESR